MIQYKKFVALLTAATTAVVMVNGISAQAADRQTNAAQISSAEVYGGAFSSASVLESIPESALSDTKNAAQKAYEQYLEEKRKEEEARKAAEEAQRAKEEAERLAAEQAAAEAAAAEAAAQQQAMQASADDQALLASIIFCEAGNQPYEGQVAVGAVILNRVRSSVYPNSISEVIYQSGQFGPAMSGWLDTVRASGSYTATAMQAAADALAGSNPIGDCLYFGCGDYGIQIGDHFFH